MPRLLLFVVCERVIVSQENIPSIINILQRVSIGMPAEDQIPEEATLPLRWYAFTMWHRQSGDEGKRYNQEVVLQAPDGTILGSSGSSFEMKYATQRIASEFPSFPIKQFGPYAIKLYLGEEGGERKEIAEFPIEVARTKEEST